MINKVIVERKDTLVIFHNMGKNKPCIDGITSAYVASLIFRESNVDYLGWVYGPEIPNVTQYKDIYILDFTFPASVLKEWTNKGKNIVIIDHHEKMMKELLSTDISERLELNFDNLESGASLTWKYFFPNTPLPVFIDYVKDRDLWNHKLPNSIQINEGMYSLIKEALNVDQDNFYINMGGILDRQLFKIYSVFNLFNQLKDLTQEEFSEYLLPIGATALERKKEIIDKLIKENTFEVDLLKERILVCYYPPQFNDLRSDICNRMYKKYPHYPYVIGYCQGDINDKYDSNYYLSFRSDKNGSNYDVAEVASKFGGGGHRNAAGALLKELPWEN